jgi:hypothetical protein
MVAKKPEEPDQGTRFRLNKEVSITDIVTIVIATSALFGAYHNLDNRTQILETTNVAQQATDKRQDDEAQRTRDHIDAGLSKLNDKLDRLLERQPIAVVPQPGR